MSCAEVMHHSQPYGAPQYLPNPAAAATCPTACYHPAHQPGQQVSHLPGRLPGGGGEKGGNPGVSGPPAGAQMALEDALGWEGASEEDGTLGELLESPVGETPHLVVGFWGTAVTWTQGLVSKSGRSTDLLPRQPSWAIL